MAIHICTGVGLVCILGREATSLAIAAILHIFMAAAIAAEASKAVALAAWVAQAVLEVEASVVEIEVTAVALVAIAVEVASAVGTWEVALGMASSSA